MTAMMTSHRVVRHLLDAGKVSRGQVDEAERMRGFFGGLPESHLLKLAHIDELTLGTALTEVTGVPYATGEHLRAIPEDVTRAVPQAVIEKHRVCPFRLENRQLRVAMLDPTDRSAAADLQAATGLVIEPWVTSEIRLYQALERNYRIRFQGVKAIKLAPSPAAGTPRTAGPPLRAAPPPAAPEPEIGLDGLPLGAEVDAFTGSGVPDRPAPLSVPSPAPAPEPPGPSARTPGPSADLEETLGAAWDRDSVAEALLDFAEGRGARAALFAVGREGVRGVAGRGRGMDTATVRRVELPVKSGTIFETALGSRDFYFGVVPVLPPNRDLYTVLGGRIPATVLVVPIVVKERTAALLYLDGDDAPLAQPDITLLRRIAAKAGIAFEIVLLRSKLRAI